MRKLNVQSILPSSKVVRDLVNSLQPALPSIDYNDIEEHIAVHSAKEVTCACAGMVVKNGVCPYVKVQMGDSPCGCGAPIDYQCEHKQ